MDIAGPEDLIEKMRVKRTLKSRDLERALRAMPRHLFVPKELLSYAYNDEPLHIGYEQTISQPTTVVIMTEALDVKKGHNVLEIGTGSGWQSAILSYLVGKDGTVFTVERIHELIKTAKTNLKKMGANNVKVIEGDGSKGLKRHAPYNRIIVTAASPNVPDSLKEQLKIGGKMVIPVGKKIQTMMLIKRISKDKFKEKKLGSFSFVPMIGKYGFMPFPE